MIQSDFPTRQPAPKIGENGTWLEWDEQTQAYVDTGRPSRGDSAGLSDDIKTALLTLAQKAAYVDEHGQDYYDALYAALYPPAELLTITASFAQGSHVVYDTDSLDSLKPYLTVTGAYDDGTSKTVTNYTLSGTLTEGTSTIAVTASGKTATFTVTVSHKPNTTAQILESGKILAHRTGAPYYRLESAENGCVTIQYPMGSKTNVLYPAGIIPTDDAASMNSENTGTSTPACLFVYDENGEPVGFVNELLSRTSFGRWVQKADTEMTEFSQSWTLGNGQVYYSGIAFSLDSRYLDDAYMYDKSTGQVWFAGVNTPYYGETNAYGTLESISVVFNPGQNVIYSTDTLDSLRQYLTVTAHHAGNVDRIVTAYFLNGTLTEGTSTVTVEFGGKTATFSVTAMRGTTALLTNTNTILAKDDSFENSEYFVTRENGGVTIYYQMDTPTNILYPAGIIPTANTTIFSTAPKPSVMVYDENKRFMTAGFVNEENRWVQDASGTMTEFSKSWTLSAGNYSFVRMTIDIRYVEDAYMYDKTTGQVWFAGKNTPYFGMANISEAGGV